MRLGHEVHLLSQERHPERAPFLAAAGDWDGGSCASQSCRAQAPATGPRDALPPGHRRPAARLRAPTATRAWRRSTFAECTPEEIDALHRRERRRRRRGGGPRRPEVALANHLVMGPVILARALDAGGSLRGQGPRQRAGVHRQARARSASSPRRARASPRRAACSSARTTPRAQPLGGDRRSRAARAHAARARPVWTSRASLRASPPRARRGTRHARAAAARRPRPRARRRRGGARERLRSRSCARQRPQIERLDAERRCSSPSSAS